MPKSELLSLIQCLQMEEASSDEELQHLFSRDEASAMLIESGYRSPVSKLKVEDKEQSIVY